MLGARAAGSGSTLSCTFTSPPMRGTYAGGGFGKSGGGAQKARADRCGSPGLKNKNAFVWVCVCVRYWSCPPRLPSLSRSMPASPTLHGPRARPPATEVGGYVCHCHCHCNRNCSSRRVWAASDALSPDARDSVVALRSVDNLT